MDDKKADRIKLIGYSSDDLFQYKFKTKKEKNIAKQQQLFNYTPPVNADEPGSNSEPSLPLNNETNMGTCCYCDCRLYKGNYTREHIIPRHKGGRVIKPACRDCNSEKGGMMLHTYIQWLNLLMADTPINTVAFQKVQIKIANANQIAIEIENQNYHP